MEDQEIVVLCELKKLAEDYSEDLLLRIKRGIKLGIIFIRDCDLDMHSSDIAKFLMDHFRWEDIERPKGLSGVKVFLRLLRQEK